MTDVKFFKLVRSRIPVLLRDWLAAQFDQFMAGIRLLAPDGGDSDVVVYCA